MRFFSSASLALLIGLGGCATADSGYVGAQAGFDVDAGVDVGVNVSANIAPPPLPVYDQPPIPGDGYIWTPGYWGWNADVSDYYWVPGTWVLPPRVGVLWTPPYWGWSNGAYLFHAGYWGPHVGFYGGINYGFGYGGFGFGGGEWRGGRLFYNRSVTNITNVNITNVYNRTVINNTVTRVSFNGGAGVRAAPRPEELAAAHETHVFATPDQQRHFQTARAEPSLRASLNHGAPAIAATARPGAFRGAGEVAAPRGEAMNRPPAEQRAPMDQPRAPAAFANAENRTPPRAEPRPIPQPQRASFAQGGLPGGGRPGGPRPNAGAGFAGHPNLGHPNAGHPGPGRPSGGRPGGGHPGGGRPAGGHPGGGHPGGGRPGGGHPGGGHPGGREGQHH